eukprot:gnl/Spiro4/9607_TR5098_c0_g1_i1.p1 gnl/Spiro4/9607_TR5098_c0_g1~~gnl/Spiro4/9607_TR5098_c0_g1_i1.p1  ORF type:complete len:336 (+),score=104.67 gnl/Spiro4/9607_TR5098_c0_g1_i1:36-1043(+)
MKSLVLLLLCCVAASGHTILDCDKFQPSTIRVLTFDVFAAAMDTYTSLRNNVRVVLPSAFSQELVNELVDSWVDLYTDFAGHVFTREEAVCNTTTATTALHGMRSRASWPCQPFAYVNEHNLREAIARTVPADLRALVPFDGPVFAALLRSWQNLVPWARTAEVLQRVSQAGILVAPLSNGDATTLRAATAVLGVDMAFIFSSDFPTAGAFKPNPLMYRQVATALGFSNDGDDLPQPRRDSNVFERFVRTITQWLQGDELNSRAIHTATAPFTMESVLHVAGAPEDARGAREFGFYSALARNQPVSGLQPCFRLPDIADLLPLLHLPPLEDAPSA